MCNSSSVSLLFSVATRRELFDFEVGRVNLSIHCRMSSPLLDALLDPKHFVPELRGGTAAEAIWEIVQLLEESGELREARAFFKAVMEREAKSSTIADGGVAYPHARTDLVDQIVLGI